jgi:predicted alpha/beta superfamily hydrolase
MRRSHVVIAASVAWLAHSSPALAQTTAPVSSSVKSPGVVGDLRLERFTSTIFANTRLLRVLLPAGYDAPENSAKRYAVLYLADGQNLFDPATSVFGPSEWRVDETVAQLVKDGVIPPMIVVGVDDAGASARAHEYLPWPDTINARLIPNYDAAPQGKQYPHFLIDEVVPFINARYRTAHDAAHTGIGGSSYGGLISAYTMLARPGVFGRVLIESPTLQIYDNQLIHMLASAHTMPGRVYLAIGTNENSAPGCDPNAAVTPRDDMFTAFTQAAATLRAAGLDSSRLRVVIAPCATHTHAAWAARLPAALAFLFHEP